MTAPLPASVEGFFTFGIEIRGEDAPQSWFRHVIRDCGTANHLAVLVLKDIVWWHRPQQKEEGDGHKKKFLCDKLQRSYNQLAEKFNGTKRQMRDCIALLKKLGLITTEVRKRVVLKSGDVLGNVMYIEIVPEKLAEITYYDDDQAPPKPKDEKKNSGHSLCPTGHTYTKRTTKFSYKEECLSGLRSDDPPSVEEENQTDLEKEKVMLAVTKLKALFQWNKTLQKEIDTTSPEVVVKAAETFERKAKTQPLGPGYFMGILKNLKNGVGLGPKETVIERLPRGVEEYPWVEGECDIGSPIHRCLRSHYVIEKNQKPDLLWKRMELSGFEFYSEYSDWADWAGGCCVHRSWVHPEYQERVKVTLSEKGKIVDIASGDEWNVY